MSLVINNFSITYFRFVIAGLLNPEIYSCTFGYTVMSENFNVKYVANFSGLPVTYTPIGRHTRRKETFPAHFVNEHSERPKSLKITRKHITLLKITFASFAMTIRHFKSSHI